MQGKNRNNNNNKPNSSSSSSSGSNSKIMIGINIIKLGLHTISTYSVAGILRTPYLSKHICHRSVQLMPTYSSLGKVLAQRNSLKLRVHHTIIPSYHQVYHVHDICNRSVRSKLLTFGYLLVEVVENVDAAVGPVGLEHVVRHRGLT